MDPNYAHEFIPNRQGKCQMIVSGKICHLEETAPVHTRYTAPAVEDAPRDQSLVDQCERVFLSVQRGENVYEAFAAFILQRDRQRAGEDATPRTPLRDREVTTSPAKWRVSERGQQLELSNEIVRALISSGYLNGTTADFEDAENVVFSVLAALRATTPQPRDWYNFAPGHELRHNDEKSLGSYDCSCGWHGSNAYIHQHEVLAHPQGED